MPFINPYYSCNIISEIYNNSFYKTYGNIVYACGDNDYGQLGIELYKKKFYIPEKVIIEEKIKDIKAYKYRTYFIAFNDNVYACGDNEYGQLGIDSTETDIRTPQKVLIDEKIKDIKIHNFQTYFITFDCTVYACGDNEYGELGVGSTEYHIRIPQKVLIEETIKDIEIYCYRTYFITFDDKVYACGDNDHGQLGIGSTRYNIRTPQKVLIEEKIKVIKTYGDQTYFITFDGKVYACGDNTYGELGVGSTEYKIRTPQKVLIEEKIKDIKSDYYQIYFITFDGTVYACGGNRDGQLGIGSTEYKIRTPQKVLIKEKIKDIKIGFCRTYFITFDSKVYACGYNKYGQLGIGSTKYKIHMPQKVLIEEKIKDIKIYDYQTYFITFDGNVYACGDNAHRQLGIGSAEHKIHTPQKIKK